MVVFIATLLIVNSLIILKLKILEFLQEFNQRIEKCVFCAGYGKTIMSLSYRHIYQSLLKEMLFFFPWSSYVFLCPSFDLLCVFSSYNYIISPL